MPSFPFFQITLAGKTWAWSERAEKSKSKMPYHPCTMFLAETFAKGSFNEHNLAGDAQSYLNMSLCKVRLHKAMCFFLSLKKFFCK